MRQFVVALILSIVILSLASWLCPRTPLIWNRMDPASADLRSVVGIHLTNTYATKSNAAGKFGKCQYVPASGTAAESISFASHVIAQEGMLELWVKPNGWAVTNTACTISGGIGLLLYQLTGGAWSGLAVVDGTGFQWGFYDGVTQTTLGVAGATMHGNVWSHIALVWSSSGDWIRMFLNGVLVGELGGDVNPAGAEWALYYGHWVNSSAYFSDAYIDNVKEFSYIDTNFLNYQAERRGMNDTVQ